MVPVQALRSHCCTIFLVLSVHWEYGNRKVQWHEITVRHSLQQVQGKSLPGIYHNTMLEVKPSPGEADFELPTFRTTVPHNHQNGT